MAYPTARSIIDSLSVRGIVILSDEKPIVLCAADWVPLQITQGGYETSGIVAGMVPEVENTLMKAIKKR